MSDAKQSSGSTSDTPKPKRSKISQDLHCPETGDLREDYISGVAGNNLSQMLTGLQHHRQQLQLGLSWAERANRIGWENAGIDVARIDREKAEADADMDNSIKLSGDTHIHVSAPPETEKRAEQPQPAPQPPQPTPKPSNKVWQTIAAATIGTILAGGGGAWIGYLLRDPAPVVDKGGASFDFDTQLPKYLESNGE